MNAAFMGQSMPCEISQQQQQAHISSSKQQQQQAHSSNKHPAATSTQQQEAHSSNTHTAADGEQLKRTCLATGFSHTPDTCWLLQILILIVPAVNSQCVERCLF